MPRVRLTAGSWLAAAAASAWPSGPRRRCALPAPARRRSAGRRARPAARRPSGRDRGAPAHEIDALQRQDAADALKRHFNIDVDWRTTPLDRLIDIRVRAAKAADLQQRLGCQRRLAALQLDRAGGAPPHAAELRAVPQLGAAPRRAPRRRGERAVPADARRCAGAPTFKDGRARSRAAAPGGRPIPTASSGRPSRAAPAAPTRARDPDGVIRPTFAVRPRWSSVAADPDGLIAPTFVPVRRLRADRADADDP